jgi:anion-transporting  ArsA/GET3 family ATPase
MDPVRFFASSRVLIVAGKGGVGKTATAATIATAAARTGLSVLLVEVAGKSAIGPMFEADHKGYEQTVLSDAAGEIGEIRGQSLTPDDALVEWLAEHGFRRIAKRMAKTGILEVVATATPGIKDILVLGKIKQLEVSHDADLIVVDAPAAGHAIGFLQSPAAVLDAARTGVINRQGRDVLELVQDGDRCRVTLVTLPEETPVNELIETSFALEDEVGLTLGPVVVNAVLPPITGLMDLPKRAPRGVDRHEMSDLGAAATLRHHRQEMQREQIERMARDLPLPQLMLPQVFGTHLRAAELETLADALLAGIHDLEETR